MLRLVWPPPRRLESSCRTKRGRKSVEEASFEKIRAFRSAYVSANSKRPIRVLDVGSGGRPGLLSFRELFAPPKFDYVGLDIDEFHNVDFVPGDPFCWTEIESESFDLVVSGSMLEHNPYFWITVAEIARVMAQDALAVLIAPSTGTRTDTPSIVGVSIPTPGPPCVPTSGWSWSRRTENLSRGAKRCRVHIGERR